MALVLLPVEEVFLTKGVEVEADLTLEKYIVNCVGDQVILLENVTIGLTIVCQEYKFSITYHNSAEDSQLIT